MSKGIPLNVLWDVLDEKYKFLAKDDDEGVSKEWYAYTHRPTESEDGLYWSCSRDNKSESLEITLPIDAMHDVPWDQTLIERPIPIQEWAFGKFWDGGVEPEDKDADWGYLMSIDADAENAYESKYEWWGNFIPKIPVHLCIKEEE